MYRINYMKHADTPDNFDGAIDIAQTERFGSSESLLQLFSWHKNAEEGSRSVHEIICQVLNSLACQASRTGETS